MRPATAATHNSAWKIRSVVNRRDAYYKLACSAGEGQRHTVLYTWLNTLGSTESNQGVACNCTLYVMKTCYYWSLVIALYA